MKKVLLLMFLFSFVIFGEETATKTDVKETDVKATDVKTEVKDNSTDVKKETSENKDATVKTDVNTEKEKPLTDKIGATETKDGITVVKDKEKSDLKPFEAGRLLIVPGIDFNLFITDNKYSNNQIMVSSDFEYQTSLLDNSLSVFGNGGIGFASSNFAMLFQFGAKYKFPLIAFNLKPFVKAGFSISPIFFDNSVTFLSVLAGGGLQYFLNGDNGMELSTDFHFGGFVGGEKVGSYIRIKTSYILVF